MTSFYDFIVQPMLDDTKVQKDASKFAERISRSLGKEGIQIPVNIDRKNLQQVMEFITKLGGTVDRIGTKVSASFTGQNGKKVSVNSNFEKSLTAYENYIRNAPSSSINDKNKNRKLQDIDDFRNTSEKFTPNEQIRQQVQQEKELIKSLQTQYDLRVKIAKLESEQKTIQSEYYQAQLDNEKFLYDAKLGEYQGKNYLMYNIDKASQTLQKNFESESSAINQKIIDDSALKESVSLINQFKKRTQETQSLLAKGNVSGEFEQTEKALDDTVEKLKKFGVSVSGGKLQFDQTAEGAVRSANNVSQLKQKIDEVNSSISILDEKTNDAFEINEQEAYQQKISEVTNTINQYVEAFKKKEMLESIGAQNNKRFSQEYQNISDNVDELQNKLKEYGITISKNEDGTVKLTLENNSFAQSNREVADSTDDANIKLNLQGKAVKSVVTDFIKYRVIMRGVEEVVQSFTSAIKDMNDAMTQVRMVNMDSREDTKKLAQGYTNLAKELGQTTTTVAEGADT